MYEFWAAALGYEFKRSTERFASWDDYWREVGVSEDELGVGPGRLVDPIGRASGSRSSTSPGRSRIESTSISV